MYNYRAIRIYSSHGLTGCISELNQREVSLPGSPSFAQIGVFDGVFRITATGVGGNHIGWMWVKGEARQFQLTNGEDFDVTDAAPLPDGGLLVLERRFRWGEGVKMRLRLIKQHQLQPGATIDGESLLKADTSREIDNMEGLAAHVGPGGEIVVTMISDDNFNHGLQRTILLQFALSAGDLAASD